MSYSYNLGATDKNGKTIAPTSSDILKPYSPEVQTKIKVAAGVTAVVVLGSIAFVGFTLIRKLAS